MRLRRPFKALLVVAALVGSLADRRTTWGEDAGSVSSAATEPIALRLKRFEIPFAVDSVGIRPVEVQLFVSRDAGKQWVRFASQSPEGKSFLFEAVEDGAYWFATRTLDGSGNAHPQGPITPQLHVLVDATDPQIELLAELKADSIAQLSIRCFDATLQSETLRVEYRTDLSPNWTGVPGLSQLVPAVGDGRMEGKLSFEPAGNWQQLSVRVIVKDGAGNQTIATHQLERARTASLQGQFASAPIGGGPGYHAGGYAPPVYPGPMNYQTPTSSASAFQQPAATRPAYPSQTYPNSAATNQAYANQNLAGQNLAGQNYPQAYGSPQLTAANGQPLPQVPAVPGQPAPMANNPYAVKAMELLNPPPGHPNLGMLGPQAGPMMTSQPSMIQSQGTPGQGVSVNGTTITSSPSPMGLNPAAIGTGTPAAAPENVTQRGPSTSVSQAMRPMSPEDLARTQPSMVPAPVNGQATQTVTRPSLTASDLGIPPVSITQSAPMPRLDETTSTSPIRFSGSRKFSLDYEVESAGRAGVEEVELWGSTDRGRTWKRWGADPDRQSPFDIETNRDGVYGFCIVVVSKNGLATPRPLEQSAPDVFVVVDTVKPQVRITGASYGEGDQTGALLIRYECLDDNLGSRPIALSFSDSFHGPWTTLAAGLENRGGYAWPADPQLPRQIYLRIDAADQAGNVGYQVLDTPIDVQGLAPRARIRGLNPISVSPAPSFTPPQTAAGQSLNLR